MKKLGDSALAQAAQAGKDKPQQPKATKNSAAASGNAGLPRSGPLRPTGPQQSTGPSHVQSTTTTAASRPQKSTKAPQKAPPPPPPQAIPPAQQFYNQRSDYMRSLFLYNELTAQLTPPPPPADGKAVPLKQQTYDQLSTTLSAAAASLPPGDASMAPLQEELKQRQGMIQLLTYDQLTQLLAASRGSQIHPKIQEELKKRDEAIKSIYQHLLSKGLVSASNKHRAYCDIDGIFQVGKGFIPEVFLGINLLDNGRNDFFVRCFSAASHTSTVIDQAITAISHRFKSAAASEINDAVSEDLTRRLTRLNESLPQLAQSNNHSQNFADIGLHILPTESSQPQKNFIVHGLGNKVLLQLEIAQQLNGLIAKGIREVVLYLPNAQLAQMPAELMAELYIEEINKRRQNFSSFSFTYETPKEGNPLRIENLPNLIAFQNRLTKENQGNKQKQQREQDQWNTRQFQELFGLLAIPPSELPQDAKTRAPITLKTLLDNLAALQKVAENKDAATAATKTLLDNFINVRWYLSLTELNPFIAALSAADIQKISVDEEKAGTSLPEFLGQIQKFRNKRIAAVFPLPPTGGDAGAGDEKKQHSVAVCLPVGWQQSLTVSLLTLLRDSVCKEDSLTKFMQQWWPVFIHLNQQQLSSFCTELTRQPDPLIQGVRRALNRRLATMMREEKAPTTQIARLHKVQNDYQRNSQATILSIAQAFAPLDNKIDAKGRLPEKTRAQLLLYTKAQLKQLSELTAAEGVVDLSKVQQLAQAGLVEIATEYPLEKVTAFLIQLAVIAPTDQEATIAILDEIRLRGGGLFLFKLEKDAKDQGKMQRLRLLASWFHHSKKDSGTPSIDKEKILQYALQHFKTEVSNKDKALAKPPTLALDTEDRTLQQYIEVGVPCPQPYTLTTDDIDKLFQLVPDYKIQKVRLTDFEGQIHREKEIEDKAAKAAAEAKVAAEKVAATKAAAEKAASTEKTAKKAEKPAAQPAKDKDASTTGSEPAVISTTSAQADPKAGETPALLTDPFAKSHEEEADQDESENAVEQEENDAESQQLAEGEKEKEKEAAKEGQGESKAVQAADQAAQVKSKSETTATESVGKTVVLPASPPDISKAAETAAPAKATPPTPNPLDDEKTRELFTQSGLLNLADMIEEKANAVTSQAPQTIPIMINIPGHWVRAILTITAMGDGQKKSIKLDVVDTRKLAPNYDRFFKKAIQLLCAKAEKSNLSFVFTHIYQSEETQPDKDGYSCGYMGLQGILKTYQASHPAAFQEQKGGGKVLAQACKAMMQGKRQDHSLHRATIDAYIIVTTSAEELMLEQQQKSAAASLPPLPALPQRQGGSGWLSWLSSEKKEETPKSSADLTATSSSSLTAGSAQKQAQSQGQTQGKPKDKSQDQDQSQDQVQSQGQGQGQGQGQNKPALTGALPSSMGDKLPQGKDKRQVEQEQEEESGHEHEQDLPPAPKSGDDSHVQGKAKQSHSSLEHSASVLPQQQLLLSAHPERSLSSANLSKVEESPEGLPRCRGFNAKFKELELSSVNLQEGFKQGAKNKPRNQSAFKFAGDGAAGSLRSDSNPDLRTGSKPAASTAGHDSIPDPHMSIL